MLTYAFQGFDPGASMLLGPLRHPPTFLSAPLTPLPIAPLHSLPVLSTPSPSLLRSASPTPARVSVSSHSGVQGRAPVTKAFPIHFEPRNRVWWQLFWFFFVLSNTYKFPDVLKMSPWELFYSLSVVMGHAFFPTVVWFICKVIFVP